MKPEHVNEDRRRLLKQGIAVAATSLAGCGGGNDESSPLGSAPTPAPTPTPPPAPAGPWAPYVPALIVGSSATFDLSATLPSGVGRGGTFGVDASGQRLPTGMSLSTAGVLAVGTAAVGSVFGVIFTYDAP